MGHMLARTPLGKRAEGQGYAVPAVTFGRRLALFFLLIALVPTGALVGILLFVSEDSRRGKADARLAAGLETAGRLRQSRGDRHQPGSAARPESQSRRGGSRR